MLLLSGPPGSGKTHAVLEQLRSAIRVDQAGVRLIVPSESLAASLRRRLAREGASYRPGLVTSLERFAAEWSSVRLVRAFELEGIIRRVLRRESAASFASVSDAPGFVRLVARLVNEFANAGFDAVQLAAAAAAEIHDGSLESAFLRVFEEVEKELAAERKVLPAERISRAAEEIVKRGEGAFRSVFMDGFENFTDPELSLIHSISRHAGVTVTLPSWDGAAPARAALRAMGAREIGLNASVHRFPVRHLVRYPDVCGEAAGIARQIRVHADAGRSYGEMAVLLRSGEPYVPALESAFERSGIPARFAFARPLAHQPVVRYLRGMVECMLGGWPHESLAPLLAQPISGFGTTPACDRFEFAVRERLPGAGLHRLRELCDAPRLLALLDRLEALESWRSAPALPADWAFRLRNLRCLTQVPAVSDGVPWTTSAMWRSTAQAIDAWCTATDEASSALPATQTLRFGAFWETFLSVLEHTPFVARDLRANAVDVLPLEESLDRAWPVVFVPGLAQGWFPQAASPEPLFDDTLRRRLQVAHIPAAIAAERRAREEFLFDVACTRASSELVLSWPARGTYGLPLSRSVLLDEFEIPEAPAAPAPLERVEARRCRSAYLRDAEVLDAIAASRSSVTPAAVEAFLECPLRFFLLSTLELEETPAGPDRRLSPADHVEVVRAAFCEQAAGEGAGLEEAFERAFARVCQAERIPSGPYAEVARARMLRTVRNLARCSQPGTHIRTNEEIAFDLGEDVSIQGRIDAHAVDDAGHARVRGFRYRPPGPKGPLEEQLYLLALVRNYGYVPGEVNWLAAAPPGECSWRPVTAGDLERAARTAVAAVREMRRGRVEARPDTECCRACEFPDICRQRAGSAAVTRGPVR